MLLGYSLLNRNLPFEEQVYGNRSRLKHWIIKFTLIGKMSGNVIVNDYESEVILSQKELTKTIT